MGRLFCILITRNDTRIINAWLKKHAFLFEYVSIVDGSDNQETCKISNKFNNVIYQSDPDIHVTDQTLRSHGFDGIKAHLKSDDWIYLGHPDEHLFHNPRAFIHLDCDLIFWLPLVVLPHPSEHQSFQAASYYFDPSTVFSHIWYRQDENPHLEYRMFRVNDNTIWDLESRVRSNGVIPISSRGGSVSHLVPLYFHYKVYQPTKSEYGEDGVSLKSKLDTGVRTRINNDLDLYYSELNIWGEGYTKFTNNLTQILLKFGNPPRLVFKNGCAVLVNDFDVDLSCIDLSE